MNVEKLYELGNQQPSLPRNWFEGSTTRTYLLEQ